jgi:hypothetical protein
MNKKIARNTKKKRKEKKKGRFEGVQGQIFGVH